MCTSHNASIDVRMYLHLHVCTLQGAGLQQNRQYVVYLKKPGCAYLAVEVAQFHFCKVDDPIGGHKSDLPACMA
jgi:hypothetical protein